MGDSIDAGALENDPSVIFVLDRDWRFRLCNAAWDRFAQANGGEKLLRSSILGRPLFDALSGEVAGHYRRAFQRVLETGALWQQEYECSSSQAQRRFSMQVYPVDGELLVVNALLVEGPHPGDPLPPSEGAYRNSDGILVMCSNCRRAKTNSPPARWDWVPGFVSTPPAYVSHGLCPPCYEYYCSRL